MGYGTRALELLTKYYEGMIPSLNENQEGNRTKSTEIESINEEEVGLLQEKIGKACLDPFFLFCKAGD